MTLTAIPGYKDLFGDLPKTYDQFMQGIPCRLALPILIGLNGETYANLGDAENQKRIRNLFSDSFTPEQARRMNQAFDHYQNHVNPGYKGDVFGNRYLVEMCIRELNRNDQTNKAELTQEDEYNLLQAYLIVIQEVNDADQARFLRLESAPKDENYDYRLLWEGFIIQHEFTDQPHAAYIVYKLLQFCLYAKDAFHNRFKEYLEKFNIKTPIDFIISYTVQALAAVAEHPEKAFRRGNFIHSNDPIGDRHLAELNIGPLVGTGKSFRLADIKAHPLYLMNEHDYQIIDTNLLLKKVYLGPFFELFKNTGLKTDLGETEQKAFNTYSTQVSDNVLEKRCFKEIVLALRQNADEIFHFDDETDNCPDGYCRTRKRILLIEFKGYVFRADLTTNPDFTKVKQYMDERFVENEKGRAKGIGQIADQIDLLAKGKFAFDPALNTSLPTAGYTVYPVICHTDYYFSMPGVTRYLQEKLTAKLKNGAHTNIEVRDLTVIDLAVIFDLIHHGKNLSHLMEYIDAYHLRMAYRRNFQKKSPSVDHFLDAHASFDEVYRTEFSHSIRKLPLVRKYINGLLDASRDELQKPL